jgi:hypothetical protein
VLLARAADIHLKPAKISSLTEVTRVAAGIDFSM